MKQQRFLKGISLALLLLLVCTLFASCGGKKVSKEDAELMAGKWNMVLYDLCGVKMLQEDAQITLSLDFQKNGKGNLDANGQAESFKWEKDDTLITVWLKDGPISRGHTATWEDGYLIWYWEHEGQPVKFYLAPEGSEYEDPARYIGEGDITSSMIMNAEGAELIDLLGRMTPEAREAFDLEETYQSLVSPDAAE